MHALTLVQHIDAGRRLNSSVLGQAALDAGHLAVPVVDAVVVDPVFLLHPLHLPAVVVAKPTAVVLPIRPRACVDAVTAVALADVEVDAVVVGDEWRVAPVRLDAAALRGPVLRRPDAGVAVHRPAGRESHAVALLVVAEHPDGHRVHVPDTIMQGVQEMV